LIRARWVLWIEITTAAVLFGPTLPMKAHGIGSETVAKIQLSIGGGLVQGVVSAENIYIGSQNLGAPPKE